MTPHTAFYRNNTHTDWQPFGNGLPVKLHNNYIRPFYKAGKLRMATIFNTDATVNAVDRNLYWRVNNGVVQQL